MAKKNFLLTKNKKWKSRGRYPATRRQPSLYLWWRRPVRATKADMLRKRSTNQKKCRIWIMPSNKNHQKINYSIDYKQNLWNNLWVAVELLVCIWVLGYIYDQQTLGGNSLNESGILWGGWNEVSMEVAKQKIIIKIKKDDFFRFWGKRKNEEKKAVTAGRKGRNGRAKVRDDGFGSNLTWVWVNFVGPSNLFVVNWNCGLSN